MADKEVRSAPMVGYGRAKTECARSIEISPTKRGKLFISLKMTKWLSFKA